MTLPVDTKPSRVIALLFTSVVAVVVPDTVNVLLSVIAPPLVKARFPFTVPCTPKAVVVLSIVACPVVPAVVKITFPVDAKVSKVIALSFTSVVAVVVPDTVKTALSVITPPLVKAKFPFTVPCTPKSVVVLSIVA